jgi:hypothetical protein
MSLQDAGGRSGWYGIQGHLFFDRNVKRKRLWCLGPFGMLARKEKPGEHGLGSSFGKPLGSNTGNQGRGGWYARFRHQGGNIGTFGMKRKLASLGWMDKGATLLSYAAESFAITWKSPRIGEFLCASDSQLAYAALWCAKGGWVGRK